MLIALVLIALVVGDARMCCAEPDVESAFVASGSMAERGPRFLLPMRPWPMLPWWMRLRSMLVLASMVGLVGVRRGWWWWERSRPS